MLLTTVLKPDPGHHRPSDVRRRDPEASADHPAASCNEKPDLVPGKGGGQVFLGYLRPPDSNRKHQAVAHQKKQCRDRVHTPSMAYF